MKLYVCYTTSTMGGYGHPCGVAAHALRDAYEEAIDLAIYLRGVMAERDGA